MSQRLDIMYPLVAKVMVVIANCNSNWAHLTDSRCRDIPNIALKHTCTFRRDSVIVVIVWPPGMCPVFTLI